MKIVSRPHRVLHLRATSSLFVPLWRMARDTAPPRHADEATRPSEPLARSNFSMDSRVVRASRKPIKLVAAFQPVTPDEHQVVTAPLSTVEAIFGEHTSQTQSACRPALAF